MEYTKPLFTCTIVLTGGESLELADTPEKPVASRAKLQFDAHETIDAEVVNISDTSHAYIPFHSVLQFTYTPVEGAEITKGDPYGCEKATRLIISGTDDETFAFADNSDIKTFDEFAAFMLEHIGEPTISASVLAFTTPDIPGASWGDGSANGSGVKWSDANGVANDIVIDPANERIYFEGSE